MDYTPHIYRNQNGLKPSFKYLTKRCLWFNSDFFSDFVLIDGKIYEISFDTNPFEIYKFNRLKVLTYIRDSNQSKPIQIKLKLPLAQSREVYNMDKESYPIIYSNHTAVESIQFNNNYSIRLIPQQIPRFTFRLDENYNSSLLSSGSDIIYNIFSYTGTIQTFNIPNNLTSLNIYCWGAGGGGAYINASGSASGKGGNGGFVKATLTIPSGITSLSIIVGQGGSPSGSGFSSTSFGGGGKAFGGGAIQSMGAGGGLSGVFINNANMTIINSYYVNTSATAFIIAGGGGGGGLTGAGDNTNTFNHGGNGGSTTANTGSGYNPGGGGSQLAGGTRGNFGIYTAGTDGSKYLGGDGAIYQAGGGGGYYGGGSGGVEPNRLGAGGGGSSFINTTNYTITNISDLKTATNGTTTAPGNTETYYQSGIGVGGTQISGSATSGGNGLVVIEYFRKRIEGITPEETLIQTTNASIPITINSKYQINYQTPIDIPKGTYQSIFDTGGIIFKDPLLIDKSYPVLNINPTAWYKFDSGNLLTDSSGNNLTLTNVNSVQFDTTNFVKGDASSSYLKSSSRYLTINNAAFNLNGSSFSISVWARPTLFNTDETPIFATGDNNNNTRSSLFLQYGGSGAVLQAGFYGEAVIQYSLTAANELNKWTHLCWTFNSANNVHLLYKNGTYVGTYTGAGSLSGSGNNYRIGGWYLNGLEKYFTGSIDDFRLYKSQVLTASQVTELYNGNFDRSYPILKDTNNNIINPLAWYQFDNSSNNMLNDSSGNGYTLTNPNGVTFSTDYIKGNGSASFDGVNDVLENTNAFNLNSKDFSISVWVKKTDNLRTDFVLTLGSDSPSNYTLLEVGYIASNKIRMGFYGNDLDTTNTYTDAGIWTHLVFTYKTGTKVRKIYRNGSQVDTNSAGAELNTTSHLKIGKKTNSGEYFKGLMDDLRIYNIELSATQVSELYNGRVSIYNPPAFMLGLELEDEKLKLSNTISTI